MNPEDQRRRPEPGPSRAGFHRFVAAKPRTLEQAIHNAVCLIEDASLESPWPNDARALRLARALLSLLTFGYARQLYSSSDLSDLARRDEDFENLSAAALPSPPLIRDFRERHRDALRDCLAAALRFLAEEGFAAGRLPPVTETQLAEETTRRLILAAVLDRMELDGDYPLERPVDVCYLFANPRMRGH